MKSKTVSSGKTPLKKFTRFDLYLIRRTCQAHGLNPQWHALDHLLDALVTESPAHQTTARILEAAIARQFACTKSAFIRQAIQFLFNVTV